LETSQAYYHSPVGLIKVSATEHCITGINYIDEPPTVFEPAEPTPLMIECIEQLIQYFNGERRVFDLPFEQTGTPFQMKVWHELMRIPFGKTISYIELARRLGDPKSIRAAASANGKNNIAIVVPCHRVIGSNRELVGYAGGLRRKRALLDLENKVANGVQQLFS
jgi:methylated-DNA-[protein]-cysteine S-methyltransferase